MELIIDSKKLRDFLNAVSMKGVIESCFIELNKEGMVVNLLNENSTITSSGLLRKESFEKYVDSKDGIGLNSINKLIGFVNTVNDKVCLSINNTGNVLTVEGSNKKANLILTDKQNIKNYINIKNLPEQINNFDNGILVNKVIFDNSLKNANILSASEMFIKFDNKNLIVNVGDSGDDSIEEKVEIEYSNNVISKFNVNLIRSIFNSFNSNQINVSLIKSNESIRFKELNDDYEVKWIIAILGDIELEEVKESNIKTEEQIAKESYEQSIKDNGIGDFEVDSIEDLLEDESDDIEDLLD